MLHAWVWRLLILSVVLTGTSSSQEPVRSPREALGYELGDRYTTHAKLVSYVNEVARRSDRVTIEQYGETVEGRELILLFVTSSANHGRLAEIRARMQKIADPRTLADGEKADELITDLPVFVWLSYNVHGNETSCSEAALKVLHELSTSADDEVKKWLDEAVVIIDPCMNPDGRDRYVNWFNSVVGKQGDPHPQSVEHVEPWPGGRFNHYYFDLNRDWAFMTQVETRSRLPHFVKWTPQVHVDYHEMGSDSSYFFFPALRPINDNLPPYTTRWGEIFGRGNSAAFDKFGWDYYTAESFDLFYPGYGDSWPSFHGAIGMTYEQAGHGRAGITIKRRDKTTLTLKDRLDHHYVTSRATIRTAVNRRVELLKDYHEFRMTAIEEGKGGPIREFILVPGDDHERAGHLVELLSTQGVEVRRATAGFSVRDATDYTGKRHAEKTFKDGVYLVSLAQPTKRLIKTLLEPRTKIKELYFYDISAWSLPLAFGVQAYWLGQPVDVASETVTEATKPTGAVAEGDATFGYLLRWDTMASVRAVIELLKAGVLVKSAGEGFTLDGRAWKAGTIFVPKGRNPHDLSKTLTTIAERTRVTFVPARTGMTQKGIDLGSRRMREVKKPRLALVRGQGISATSYGATRYVVEELYGIPYSSFDLDRLGSVDLEDFTAVVLPNGRGRLDKPATENLKSFVEDGGVVVACGGSAQGLTKDRGGFTSISMKNEEPKKKDEPKKKKPRTIKERDAERRKRSTPGSIFRVELDPSHPLSFGYTGEVAAFSEGMLSFDPDAAGTPVGRFLDVPPLAGYILSESEKKLRNRAYVIVEGRGRGSVVLMAGDPNFRSAWHGLSRLFLNATLLLPRH